MRCRKVAATILLLSQAACSTFRLVDSPGPYVETRSPQSILITRADGSALRVEQPRILLDTVFGWTPNGEEVTIPLSTVKEMRARQISAARTAAFTVALTALTITLATFVIGRGPETPEDPPEDARVPLLRFRFRP